jgi:monovalent cation/hydrogen antiporter
VPDVELLIGLVLAAAVLAGIARALSIAYPVALILGGLGLGFVPGLPAPRLDPDLVFLIFLPPLVYSAAFTSSTRALRKNVRPIGLLATGLVLATMAAVGAAAHLLAGLPWGPAFVLGAVLAPTDPVAATAVLGRLGAPQRIGTILEGEALINDGTGLTVYKIAVAAVVGGTFGVGDSLLRFVTTAAGGVAIGLLAGWLSSEVRRRIEEPTIEISVSLLTAYLAYLPADRVGASGILAAVAAGLVVGHRSATVLSATTRLQTLGFWEVVTFLLDSVLFLLIGLQFPSILADLGAPSPWRALLDVAIVIGALAVVRLAWMFGVSGAVRLLDRRGRAEPPVSPRERLVLGVCGMRGAVSLAAVLAVPLTVETGAAFPDRARIIFLTYCAILVTLVVPALGLPALLRRLGLASSGRDREREVRARIEMAHAALAKIEEAAEHDDAEERELREVRHRYRARIERLEPELDEDGRDEAAAASATVRRLRRAAVDAERRRLGQLRRDQSIGVDVERRLERELDLEESRLRT